MSIEYRIFETENFRKEMNRLLRGGSEHLYIRLTERVYPQLKRLPHFGPNIKKLKDYSPETWRYRIGPWRFFYEIDKVERIVFLISVSHRGRAY